MQGGSEHVGCVAGGSSGDRWGRVGDDAGGVRPPELEELSLQGEGLLLLIERVSTGVELGLFAQGQTTFPTNFCGACEICKRIIINHDACLSNDQYA